MRNKYQFNLNPRKLSSKDIEKHKDFDALLEKYRQSPAPRRSGRRIRLLYIGSAVAAAVVGLIFYFSIMQVPVDTGPVMSNEAYFAQQDFANPPLKNIQPSFASYTVDAEKGGTYEFAGGSRLVIPSRAFMNDRGQLIEGNVDIQYREMHDYIDFFLSGIPMTYDSAGQQYYLESAGMIELFALQDGKRINLAPGKRIEVELISEITVPNVNVSPRYNIYKLDTLSREWIYQDVDHIQFLDQQVLDELDPLYWQKRALLKQWKAIESRAEAERARILSSIPKPELPIKPQPLRSNQASIGLTLLEDVDIPGREFYQGTIWQISPNCPDFDPSFLSQEMDSFEFEPLNNLEYELTLIKGERRQRLIIMPVLSGSDYQQAVEAYEEAYADYEIRMAERKAKMNSQLAELEASVAEEKARAQRAFEAQLDSLEQEGVPVAQSGIRRRIVNRFYATSLGIWNCDRPVPLDGQSLQPEFEDQHGNEYDKHTAFLVSRDRNTVLQFYSGDGGAIHLDEDSENMIWLVSSDNKIAVLRPDQLERIEKENGEVKIVLHLVDKEIRSEADVREILQFEGTEI